MGLKVNGVEYEWGDITVTTLGRTLERVLEIEYDVKVSKKHLYGRGKKPKGIGGSNEEPTGSITIGQSEFEAMIRSAQALKPNVKITDIVLDLQVHYLQGTDLVKDRIIQLEFTEAAKGMKQGDSDMMIKMPFLALDIQYNY
ncbi:MAG: hypothetical protein C0459_03420 [Chitinophaga sp.]|jgi:hypothetical protein|nr:hypothetical protein [Chitinophaga sp.]